MVAAAGVAGAIQQGGKCPHGLPIGACPICSGMGGGGSVSRKDKPRVPGEMSYNECMAAWIKIQAAKEAKIEAQIQRAEAAQALFEKNLAIKGLDKAIKTLDKIVQNIEQMPKIIAIPVKIVINVIVKPILNLIAKIPQAINNIQAFFSNVRTFITSVGEKLVAVLGEVKNFVDTKVAQPIRKALKTVLSFFAQEENEEDEEVQKLKMREIKKVLKGIFRIKSKNREEEQEDER